MTPQDLESIQHIVKEEGKNVREVFDIRLKAQEELITAQHTGLANKLDNFIISNDTRYNELKAENEINKTFRITTEAEKTGLNKILTTVMSSCAIIISALTLYFKK